MFNTVQYVQYTGDNWTTGQLHRQATLVATA